MTEWRISTDALRQIWDSFQTAPSCRNNAL